MSPVPKGQLYIVIRPLRGYYDYPDSDRAMTPGSLLCFGHQLSPWSPFYLVGFGYCSSVFPLQCCVNFVILYVGDSYSIPLQGYIPLQAAILQSKRSKIHIMWGCPHRDSNSRPTPYGSSALDRSATLRGLLFFVRQCKRA